MSRSILDSAKKNSRVMQVAAGRRPSVFKDKTKYTRKTKYKGKEN